MDGSDRGVFVRRTVRKRSRTVVSTTARLRATARCAHRSATTRASARTFPLTRYAPSSPGADAWDHRTARSATACSRQRPCFLDPIVRVGHVDPPAAGVAAPTLVGNFCLPRTGWPASTSWAACPARRRSSCPPRSTSNADPADAVDVTPSRGLRSVQDDGGRVGEPGHLPALIAVARLHRRPRVRLA